MKNHRPRSYLLYGVGVIVIGALAWWVLMTLISLVYYVVVGALIVGGCALVYGRAKRSLAGGGRRGIGR